MGQRHSIAYIKTDGALLPTMPGAKLDLGGEVRTSVIGDNAILGYATTKKQSQLECEISLGAGMSLAELQGITDATVTYEADTGQTYVIRGAFVADTLAVTAGDGGKVTLKFEGQPAEEMGRMSDAVVYALKFPVELRNAEGVVTEKLTELTLDRLNGAKARAVLNARAKGDGDFASALIGASANVPPSTVDKLDGADFMAAMEIATGFFGVSLPTSSK